MLVGCILSYGLHQYNLKNRKEKEERGHELA